VLLVVEGGGVRRARLVDYVEVVGALLNLVPPGYVVSYGNIARLLGVSPRFIGFILSLNSNPIVTPCHRVVRSNGGLGGYSGFGGVRFKRRLLEFEGVSFEDGRVSRRCFVDLKGLLG
jgi:methylated-DNA-[protein]-cysteine S-methyltransferase